MTKHRICPWWLGYLLASPMRRWWQDPAMITGPYVREGMAVLEPGPGMGFFTLELARRVGTSGIVVALDVQERMLSELRRRLLKKGFPDRVELRLAAPDSMGLDDKRGAIDFAFVFAVVHELPEPTRFFRELAECLKPQGRALIAEPRGHVAADAFMAEIAMARTAGLIVVDRPSIGRSHAALLEKA